MAEETVGIALEPTNAEIAAAEALLARVKKPALVPTVIASVLAAEPAASTNRCLAFRTWEKTQCAALTTFWSTWNAATWVGRILKGVRTILFFTVTGGSALFASLQDIDLSGFLSKLTGVEIQSADLVLFMSAAGLGLRFITNSSAFKRWRTAARGDGEAPGIGSGDVDEPEARGE